VKKILVADDEPTLVATLKFNLERESYSVVTAADGEAALSAARETAPDLVLLDLMMPGLNGLEVCRILRKEMHIPILILTARGDETDKVAGLELGADDYVTKPFSMRELTARVRALLRRSEFAPPPEQDIVSMGDLTIDLPKRAVTKDGENLPLKPKEFELLSFLAKNPGRAFTREQLLNQIWGYDYAGDTRTVDVHVRWLRQKIETEPDQPRRVITVRGVGYRFDG
jgi:DNA-binding response OmpR family regulator